MPGDAAEQRDLAPPPAQIDAAEGERPDEQDELALQAGAADSELRSTTFVHSASAEPPFSIIARPPIRSSSSARLAL
jgi:hypothetical protein